MMNGTKNLKSIEDISKALYQTSLNTKEKCLTSLNNIIPSLPSEFSELIESSYKYKRVPKEYCLTSILFSVSTVAGTVFHTNDLGYKNYSNLYFIIVGSRGDGKSEGLSIGTKPIKETDDELYDQYDEDIFHANKDEKENVIRKQNLLQNATIEAATKVHKNNLSGIGLCMDECFQLFDKMGNPNSRDGIEWRTFILEAYTNKHIDISRKTSESFRINQSYFTFIGGVQHQFIKKMFSNGNLESGLIDRMLFVNKLTYNTHFIDENIPENVELSYSKSIKNILEYKVWSEHPKADPKTFLISYSTDARKKLKEYTIQLINLQDFAESPLKEYLSKMQISIHKFCLVAHLMNNAKTRNFRSIITRETVELAVQLNEFYYLNFQLLLENEKSIDLDNNLLQNIIHLAKTNGAQQADVVSVTGKSKATISRYWNKFKPDNKT